GERLLFIGLILNAATLHFSKVHNLINSVISFVGVCVSALHVYRGLSDSHSCGKSIFSRLDSHPLTEHFPLIFEIKVLCSTKQGSGFS
ncbi:hypothetical protein, partial [Vibrio vulnificus]|uniref:hypothetical protein n=1 Tax=Vibrio vulnificus TaxID=672 RepID=UPI0039B391CC